VNSKHSAFCSLLAARRSPPGQRGAKFRTAALAFAQGFAQFLVPGCRQQARPGDHGLRWIREMAGLVRILLSPQGDNLGAPQEKHPMSREYGINLEARRALESAKMRLAEAELAAQQAGRRPDSQRRAAADAAVALARAAIEFHQARVSYAEALVDGARAGEDVNKERAAIESTLHEMEQKLELFERAKRAFASFPDRGGSEEAQPRPAAPGSGTSRTAAIQKGREFP
jgi:hypothetical protein